MPQKTIQLSIDYREKSSGIALTIEKSTFAVQYKFKHLQTGDYIIQNRFVAERKTTHDFLNSIKSGRLFNQAYRLAKSSFVPLLIVEGDRSVFTESKTNYKAIEGAILHLKLFAGIPLFYSASQAKTIELFNLIAHQYTKTPQPRRVKTVNKSFNKNRIHTDKQKVLFLQNLPGIGYQRALSLLESFGSIENVMEASVSELSEIPGIGLGVAGKIHEFVHATYQQDNGNLATDIDFRKLKF